MAQFRRVIASFVDPDAELVHACLMQHLEYLGRRFIGQRRGNKIGWKRGFIGREFLGQRLERRALFHEQRFVGPKFSPG